MRLIVRQTVVWRPDKGIDSFRSKIKSKQNPLLHKNSRNKERLAEVRNVEAEVASLGKC